MTRPGNSSPSRRLGPAIITVLVVVLLIVHQDNWFWNDARLVFGFMPIGMFWHVCISLAATLTWALASRIAWPIEDTDSSEEAR